MGTINYGTSNYITMGIKPVDGWDLLHDPELKTEIEAEVEEYGGSLEEAAQSLADDYNEADYDNAKEIYEKYDFNYFEITMNYGYYDGFYFDISPASYADLETYKDKRNAQKEITQIKKMFVELAGVGVVACSPGWGTSYRDYKGTLKEINKAIKQMREEVKASLTDLQLARRSA